MDVQGTVASRSLRLGLLVAALTALLSGLFAWWQVGFERRNDLEDVNRRASVLARQLESEVGRALQLPDGQARDALAGRLDGFRRLLGYGVYRADGSVLTEGGSVAEVSASLAGPVLDALEGGNPSVVIDHVEGRALHALVHPLGDPRVRSGALVVVHDVSYLGERATERLVQYAFWVLIITLVVPGLVVAGAWIAFERPLARLALWMRRLRTDNATDAPPGGLPSSRLRSESDRLAASFRAARAAGRALSEATQLADSTWTSHRLQAHALAALGECRELVVVSHREPCMHVWRDGKPHAIVPAGGLVTALDPVLRACGGTWIAHGAGDADRETADAGGRLTVPPGDSRYTLKRLWLTREEEQGYYYGFSNEGLWPLCHLAHERPEFRAGDWEIYRLVNRRFADAVLQEIGPGNAVVLVQDYQLALVPGMIKEVRPDIRVGLFWHIPWPTPEAFRICPWGPQIIEGMLGADLLGFHLQQYCNNFLDTADRLIECRMDWDQFAIELGGHRSSIRPFPISIQPWSERGVQAGEPLDAQCRLLRSRHKLPESAFVAVGVDRIDYTKGLAERFRACARLLEKHPEFIGRFVMVELGAPSRTHIPRYRAYLDSLEALADEINWKFRTDDWKPIHFLVGHHDADTVHAFMHIAQMCVVSSVHDGMNLVAKEYVASCDSSEGVLVLSEFAGAARELDGALLVNPHDIEEFAEALKRGIDMDPAERKARMQRMTRQVEEHNVYRWAAGFLTELGRTSPCRPDPERT